MATANKAIPAAPNKVASINPAKTGTTASGLRFTKKKTVTVPVLKLMPNAPVYVKVESAMTLSKQIDTGTVNGEGKKKMEPATILHCVDHQTDDECIVIVGKVLEGVLNETYPNNSYVGKSFEIINRGKVGDKKYNTYSVTEVEIESE